MGMWGQGRRAAGPRKLRDTEEALPRGPGCGPAPTLSPDPWPPEGKEEIPVVLNHTVCGNVVICWGSPRKWDTMYNFISDNEMKESEQEKGLGKAPCGTSG